MSKEDYNYYSDVWGGTYGASLRPAFWAYIMTIVEISHICHYMHI